MKQYVVDGLRAVDFEKLKSRCTQKYGEPSLSSIFWIEIPDAILDARQKAHPTCGPHYFTIELSEERLSCEFLIRIKKKVKCDCMGYANREQRGWIMDAMDDLLEELDITV